MPRCCIRPARSARRSTYWRSRRPRRIPTSSASSAISICRRRTARRSSGTGGSGRAWSASASPSTSRTRRAGGPTAASTGSGPPANARNCRSGCSPAATWRRSARSPSAIPASNCISTITAAAGGGGGADRRRGVRRPARDARAGQIAECRGQDFGRAELFSRALPVPQHAGIHTADHRRVRSAALLLGHRRHPHAVQLPAMRDDVHRGIAVAARAATSNSSWGARSCEWLGWNPPGLAKG